MRLPTFVVPFLLALAPWLSFGEEGDPSAAKESSLRPLEFVPLPVGSVNPEGWLRDQLTLQANGLTGHLDQFWPSLAESAWKGGSGEAWERGPYYLDGLVPLAYVLDDPKLIGKTKPWIEWMLASGRPDGWFGPEKNKDRWPLAVAMKVLAQYHEATGDPRAITMLKNYFAWLGSHPPDWPDKEWRGVRAMENAVTAYWLYRKTGDPEILRVIESIYDNSYDWGSYFREFPWDSRALRENAIPHQWDSKGLTAHVVNVSMAIKYPGLWYQQAGDDRFKQAVFKGLENLDAHHGQAGGRFSGDEHLAGRRPTQGTELCAVVEFMYSLENLIPIFRDPPLADRLEMLAYNALPGTWTEDCWAHQYDQQSNQVLCTVAKRNWTSNGDDSNVYGLEPHYGCCTSNMHQGWPKFIVHMWMATPDQGLAAITYGPTTVTAEVANGAKVTIVEETQYPFDGEVVFRVDTARPVEFPLHLRIPSWASGATVTVVDQVWKPVPGQFLVVSRLWHSGDTVKLHLPMKLRAEIRYNNAVAIYRGPLLFALKIGENRKKIKSHHPSLPSADWEIYPTTPWNYALILDPKTPEDSLQTRIRGAATRADSVPFHSDRAPVSLIAKAHRIPSWVLVDNSAGDPPVSPVTSSEPTEEVELIPYGSTRLRITEFPYVLPNE